MGATNGEPTAVAPPRCAACGEVIGVYEPLVHLVGGTAHTTSRAADPDIVRARPVYHLACSDLAGDEAAATE